MKEYEYLTEEVILVYQLLHHLIQECSNDNKNNVDIKSVEVSASERFISRKLLISYRRAREACSKLNDQGYLNSKIIAGRAVYSLGDVVLSNSSMLDPEIIISDSDLCSVIELVDFVNTKFKSLIGFDGHLLQNNNKFHIIFLKTVLQYYHFDIEHCQKIIELTIDSI